jgi:hypothetical protein
MFNEKSRENKHKPVVGIEYLLSQANQSTVVKVL